MNDFLKGYRSILSLDDLTLTEKMILCEIVSLSTQKGCFASRSHFSKVFGISVRTVTNSWKKLKKNGYIKQYKRIENANSKNKHYITEVTHKTKALLPHDLEFKKVEYVSFEYDEIKAYDERGKENRSD